MTAADTLSLLRAHSQSETLSELPGPRLKSFGDSAAEWKAVEEETVLFDLNQSFCWRMTGKDRIKFMNNFCTNNMVLLQPGSGCETFSTSVKGRVLGHLFVVCETDSLLLIGLGGDEEELLKHFRKYVLLDDVQITPLNEQYELFYMTGNGAGAKAEEVIGTSLERWQTAEVDQFEQPFLSVRIDLFDMPGYLLMIPQNDVATHWKYLTENGILAAGADCFHTLRIESGLPLCGIDISEDNLAHEAARTSSAISFTKGCYLGQEPIARLETLGHTNQELRSVSWDGAHIFSPGAALFTTAGEKQIGRITSTCLHPDGTSGRALAMVRREYLESGTAVLIDAEGVEKQLAVVL
ncbi:Aminomethyltransferase [Polystyrenella longa]|uniref:Aminomethyltransferase n=1 Tax=Polystyrenella longa TaxID=2528007 RepID=A0A518CHH7_9PLAN|nr:hypothetical protein [Polystyrenella longa]QDU78682.1 Aminomethyltransferase [Polystyrenella longa]